MRSRTSNVLCADVSFPIYFSIQTETYSCRQEGRRFERPNFLAKSFSFRQLTHSLGFSSSHNDGSYRDLRTFTTSLLVHLAQKLRETCEKNGKNRILDEVTPVATFRMRTRDNLDEACSNADDRMMIVRHRSGNRVMS